MAFRRRARSPRLFPAQLGLSLLCVAACSGRMKAATPMPAPVQAKGGNDPGQQSTKAIDYGMEAAYGRAEAALPWNLRKLVYRDYVAPQWDKASGSFWYTVNTREGREYWRVDVAQKTRTPAFDREELAQALKSAGAKVEDSKGLNVSRLSWQSAGKLKLRYGGDNWSCDLDAKRCSKLKAGGKGHPKGASVSPDGQWSVYVKDFNLMLHRKGGGRDVQLTKDGERKHHYAKWLPGARPMIRAQSENPPQWVEVEWSADSSRFVTYRLDWREALELDLVQAIPPDGGIRPRTFRYPYALPGETKLCTQEPVVFELRQGKARRRAVKAPEIPIRYYDDAPYFRWSRDAKKVRYVEYGRGNSEAWLREIDVATGKTRDLIHEQSKTVVDPRATLLRYLDGREEILWSSERDGWNHLYLYGNDGKLKRQLTKGEFVVRSIERVDEDAGVVFFSAGGKESGRDPYLRHLYRLDLRGGKAQLLTPEDAEHAVSFSPDGRFFVDNYSRADLTPVSVLRRSSDGKVVMELERADVQDLVATGWKGPEPFAAKGRDGKTDIYGVIYRPSTFDPKRRYPVIENIYAGPGGFNVSKSFSAYRNSAQAVAELGFVVVVIDGMGTGKRSKAFHDVAFRNLGDSGFPDRIAAIKELGRRYAYLDVGKVGIYGFSAGGYNSARALLAHPDFYKVGVSASGNHDHRLDKADWNEKWMGFPVGENYAEQSNFRLADQLKGKLLLAYGELDHNVPPVSTIRLVDALIKANKDFDLLIMPNEAHYLEEDPYFVRRRWDYFVEHLLGEAPPEQYRIAGG